MARSMTAFARVETTAAWGRASWELRSVNHRYLEVGLRLPEDLRVLEGEVRARIAQHCNRGKVDAVLRFEAAGPATGQLRVNLELARQVVTAAQAVAALAADSAPLDPLDVLRWPRVLETPEVDLDALSTALLALLDEALAQLVESRAREGAKLAEVVAGRCAALAELATGLRARVPEIVAAIRARHVARIAELVGGADPARVEQECALLLQRLDVAEELDRLEAHLGELTRVMRQAQPIGRRLDFLLQELNREANTLGSKSAHIDTSGAAVELKVLIEQIREQIQNIE
jgi:uncharacterized protein (TIGR00255 family)